MYCLCSFVNIVISFFCIYFLLLLDNIAKLNSPSVVLSVNYMLFKKPTIFNIKWFTDYCSFKIEFVCGSTEIPPPSCHVVHTCFPATDRTGLLIWSGRGVSKGGVVIIQKEKGRRKRVKRLVEFWCGLQ